MREIVPRRIETTYIELHDNVMIDLNEVSWEIHQDLFKFKEMPRLPQEREENTQILITIEREFNVLSIERMAYTTFNLLSDIGGLSGIVMLFCRFVNTLWNFNAFDNFMISRLYKIKLPKEEVDNKTNHFN